ncbi:hypothetical protein BJV78DRAFT_1252328, partial [Lactifluus subvellereus]
MVALRSCVPHSFRFSCFPYCGASKFDSITDAKFARMSEIVPVSSSARKFPGRV